MRKLGKALFIISSAFSFLITACGGSAIGDAQEFSPNEAPSILSIKAVNLDGSEIKQLDIEPYKQFKLIVEATDPDNNPLQYKFDSESGTFAGITANSTGCTAIFKTGRVVGGQNVEFWAGVSDGRGALVRQSYNLGTGKSGPTLVAILEKIRFRPGDKIKLTVTANCSGFFQLYSNGTGDEKFEFEKDMFRFFYSENKTTDFILGGPKCTGQADIVLESRPECPNAVDYKNEAYNLVLIFRDGLFQTSKFVQTIIIDGKPPLIKTFFPAVDTAASTDPEVTVTFDEEIGYADSSSLKLDPADGKIKLKSISGSKAVFSVSGLDTSQKYIATVSGIQDIAGNVMAVDSSHSFTTRKEGSADFKVKIKDSNETSYTAYAGFNDSTVELIATLNGQTSTDVTYSSDSDMVTIDSSTGKLTVNPKEYKPATDDVKTVTVTATSSSADTAYFTVTIEPYYPIYKSSCVEKDLPKIYANLNGRFKLMESIDIGNDTSGNVMYPIGSFTNASNNKPFTGIFDGNDKTLSNFSLKAGTNNDENYAGLFAYNTGTIKNLIVDKAKFEGPTVSYVGIICGYNQGVISGCEVKGINIKANDNVGGLIGHMRDGTIEDCSSAGSVKGNDNVGGLIGRVNNNLQINFNSKKIYANCEVEGRNYVGGFIGNVTSDSEITIKGKLNNHHFNREVQLIKK